MATITKKVNQRKYQVLRDLADTEKCPPQAKLIVNTINAAGGIITRESLLEQLKRPTTDGGLTTKQTPERVLGFYRPKLEEMGVIKEVVEVVEVQVEVPDPPAKAEGAAEGAAEAGDAPAAEGAPAEGEKGKKGKKKVAA